MTRWTEAREELQAALARVPPERGDLRAEFLITMAKTANWDFSDAAITRSYAEEAFTLAEQAGREDLAVAALSCLVVPIAPMGSCVPA